MDEKNQNTQNEAENGLNEVDLLVSLSELEALLIKIHAQAGRYYRYVPDSRYYVTAMMNQTGFLTDKFEAHFSRPQ